MRRYLAWESILAEREALNLDPHQVRQAETQLKSADGAVTARLPETYQWLLVPVQATPQAAVAWQAFRLSGTDALAVRASKKLRNDELLITALRRHAAADGAGPGAAVARRLTWRCKQLAEDFARYLYLPRLAGPEVLAGAVRAGLGLLTWNPETFAYADSHDEATGRYIGLRCGQDVGISSAGLAGLLVRPEVAARQRDADLAAATGGTRPLGPTPEPPPGGEGEQPPGPIPGGGIAPPPRPAAPRRFHGSVTLDSTRAGRDAGRVAEEIIAHLVGLTGSRVKVTLEIEAEVPGGVTEDVVRTVTENSRSLNFTTHGFESE